VVGLTPTSVAWRVTPAHGFGAVVVVTAADDVATVVGAAVEDDPPLEQPAATETAASTAIHPALFMRPPGMKIRWPP